ncbi:siphovirus Gp157 family protein [Crocosphaera sp. UHCC 0190]|uniref:siphovirus Gp157 family protein n=1 Tax=Crocosphaera sp. UHCC 0190 TaxID=3110246 RepID=UPI002B217A05|nr:siphovirus Gp157 family protein [Crocosphaera sp. UHCC 0190]MEA5511793.1 siphovirus Gp157 family protein [Crocosphaera sp. UHCC 0190]
MENARLWELSNEIVELESLIDEIEDCEDLTESEKEVRLNHVFSEWLNSDSKFNEKAEKVAHFIKYLEAVTEARQAEAKRLKTLAETSEKQATKLREYLAKEMLRVDKRKVEGVTCKLSMRRKQPRICLNVEPEQLPSEYQRVKIEANMTEIRKALKGKKLDWAFLSESIEYSLMIK